MTPEQCRDLIHSLLAWRGAQGAPLVDGSEIVTVVSTGPGTLVLTAGDCRYVISVKTYPRRRDGRS